MFLERFESEGLAHYSYLIGEGIDAAVIDPRRDCGIYIQRASVRGCGIRHILETHRNEDYLIGSGQLSERTGAPVWHADSQWDYRYGREVKDGQQWKLGSLRITSMLSPGHTPGMMSYILEDPTGEALIVFTGDALFAGDVGRVDLLGPEMAEEMAGRMYHTIFDRILPLGDGVIICPAHGPGSVCGSSISGRAWTTIGLEKELNPRLAYRDRDEFISKTAIELKRPPYFRKMEELNLKGTEETGSFIPPNPLTPDGFHGLADKCFILDVRSMPAFGAAHLEGSLYIWKDGIPAHAGWLIPYGIPLLLVAEEHETAKVAALYLYRMGYDNIAGYLTGGIINWHTSGRSSESTEVITVQQLCSLLDRDNDIFILDVRSESELASQGKIPGALNIPVTMLPEKLDLIPEEFWIYIFCGSGLRSMVSASLLEQKGRKKLTVVIGGLSAWNSSSCPVET